MDELIRFMQEHLWLFLWIAISIFSAITEYRKKKEQAELEGQGGSGPEGTVIPHPELELESMQQRFQAQIPYTSFDKKLRAYEEATATRAELRAVHQLLKERVRPELERRWKAAGQPEMFSLSDPLKRWLEEQLQSAELIISSLARSGGEELKLVESLGREALTPFERFARSQGVAYEPRSVLAVPGYQIAPSGLPAHLLAARPAAASQPLELPLVVAALGTQIHDSIDGLGENFAAALELPRELPLLSHIQQASGAYLRAAHGPSLRELFGDLYAVGFLGPAYGEALLYEIEEHHDLNDAFTFPARGWELGGLPLALRFQFTLHAIERESRGGEAAALRSRFNALTSSIDGYRLVDQRGAIGRLPRQAVEAITAELSPKIFAFRHPALDGFALTRVPGLDLGVSRQRRIALAAEALTANEIPAGSLSEAVAAAALLAGSSRERSRDLAGLLLRKHRGEEPIKRTKQRAQKLPSASGDRPFAELLSDRDALRDAVALGAILSPRRPR